MCVTVVVPCYLPNEKDIIMDTIYSIVDELQYTGELILHVVSYKRVDALILHQAPQSVGRRWEWW